MFYFFDRWPSPKADGHYALTQESFSSLDIVSTAFGVDKSKNKNTDITDFARINLSRIFFFDIILPMSLGFRLDSEGFGALWCSLLTDEFVTPAYDNR